MYSLFIYQLINYSFKNMLSFKLETCAVGKRPKLECQCKCYPVIEIETGHGSSQICPYVCKYKSFLKLRIPLKIKILIYLNILNNFFQNI